MNKLWLLLAVSLVIAKVIDIRDQNYRYLGSNKRDRLFTVILILVLGFFCGLRIWGNDTVTYLQIYEQTEVWDVHIETADVSFAHGIGFGLLTSLIKTLGFSSQDYLMIYAFLTVIPYVLFVRRHSGTMVFGVFLMFTTGFYTFSMAAIKQCMATGLCLIAVNYALDRKWLGYGIFLFLGTMFHPYALIYLMVPLLNFKPWTNLTFVYIAAFMGAGFFLESLLGTVLDITDMMGANYDAESFTGEGVNIFRVLVCFAPLALATLTGRNLFRNSTRTDNLMFNIAMANALIMFVGLFGTANYFARLANYFLPGQIITIPWILRRMSRKERNWLTLACIIGYTGYFIYENAIIRPFDTSYSHLSFWDYISNWF